MDLAASVCWVLWMNKGKMMYSAKGNQGLSIVSYSIVKFLTSFGSELMVLRLGGKYGLCLEI